MIKSESVILKEHSDILVILFQLSKQIEANKKAYINKRQLKRI